MDLPSWSGNAIATSAALVLFLWLKHRRDAKQLPLPPGPRRLPLIGNLLDLPKDTEWVKYHEWCREFGTDILYLNAAGSSIIVLDSAEAASELLEKRSSIYSGRVYQVMIQELMGWDFNLGWMPYGDAWRQRLRITHQSFNPTASLKFRSHEENVVHHLLRRLLADPGPTDIIHHLRHMAGKLVMKIGYGIDIQEKDDPYIAAAEAGVRALFVAAMPGAFLVDMFPWLKYVPKWMPGAGFQRKAAEWKKHADAMLNNPFNETKRQIEEGNAEHSFVATSLQDVNPPGDPVQERAIMDVAGTLYTAGSDTTVSAIASCILGLLEHPDKLRKAQEQVDQVVGKDRLPDFADYDSLPYITALMKEALRWRDVAPFAIPHMVEKDDEYKGYHIPAKSMIVPNCWAILHDPETYPDPFEFKPERFLKDNGQLDPNVRDPATVAFGICGGRFLAMDSIWITLASLIAVFDIKKAVDEKGEEIPLTHKYISALGILPEPYKCSIKPRSDEAEELIAATGLAEET